MAIQTSEWWQRLGERLFGDLIQTRVQEAVAAEDIGYRQVTGASETRDDPLWDHQRLLRGRSMKPTSPTHWRMP